MHNRPAPSVYSTESKPGLSKPENAPKYPHLSVEHPNFLHSLSLRLSLCQIPGMSLFADLWPTDDVTLHFVAVDPPPAMLGSTSPWKPFIHSCSETDHCPVHNAHVHSHTGTKKTLHIIATSSSQGTQPSTHNH